MEANKLSENNKKARRNSVSEFSLPAIRSALVRQEETIIFAIIERGQFAFNARVYERGNPDMKTEKLHASLGRYRAQDLEHPFFKARGLPEAALSKAPVEPWGSPLKPNEINLNGEILKRYTMDVAKKIASPDNLDDGHYGSTSVSDVTLIQALSYRIHFGKLVAESKFQAQKEMFSALIQNKDAAGIMRALTDEKVEDQVIQRVRRKAARYGRDEDDANGEAVYKVNPDLVAGIYKDFLIPLNKDVQVQYLLARLD